MEVFRQQDDVVASRPVLWVLGFVILVIIGSVIWVLVSMAVWIGDRRPEGWDEQTYPQPEEMSDVEMALFDRRAQGLAESIEQRETISTYGWVDREHEIVRIPIEKAMELYLERQEEEPR